MIRRILSLGIKLEVLQLTFAVGVIVGMIAEAALIVALITGHSLAGLL